MADWVGTARATSVLPSLLKSPTAMPDGAVEAFPVTPAGKAIDRGALKVPSPLPWKVKTWLSLSTATMSRFPVL